MQCLLQPCGTMYTRGEVYSRVLRACTGDTTDYDLPVRTAQTVMLQSTGSRVHRCHRTSAVSRVHKMPAKKYPSPRVGSQS